MTRLEGPNFSVDERESGIAVVCVWRRPDLSRDEGARCAQLVAEHMQRLAGTARACIFDLTQATRSWGPTTHRALEQMLAVWEAAAKPIFIVQAEEPIQRILLRELQRQFAPRYGHLVGTQEEALQVLGTDEGQPRAPVRKRRSGFF